MAKKKNAIPFTLFSAWSHSSRFFVISFQVFSTDSRFPVLNEIFVLIKEHPFTVVKMVLDF